MFVAEALSASELWATAWAEIALHGNHRTHARGNYRDSLHSVLALNDPRQRWVLSRKPAINPAFAIAEVIWIVQGRIDAKFLTPWNRALVKYAGDEEQQYGAYGERVRARFGFDQLERAADVLSNNSEQRQVVIQIWDPQSDFPSADGHSRSRDIPCNVSSILKVVDGRLEWLQVMRSNDLVRGLPYNLVQWTSVQEVMAGWMNLDVGSYVHVADSLHVYDSDQGNFQVVSPPNVETTVDLRLGAADSRRVFGILEDVAERLADSNDVNDVMRLSKAIDPSSPYTDWLAVLGAERARRLHHAELSSELVETISDSALRAVASHWHQERRPGS